MLLAMLVLFPLAISNFDRFSKALAPAIAIFLLGWIAYAQGALGDSKDTGWTGITHTGNVRAIAEISLGCVSYVVAKRLQLLNLTNLGRCCLSVIEILCYSLVALGANTKEQVLLFVLIPVLWAAITITFSQKSVFYNFFNKKLFYWLGNFSTILYLNHLVVRTILVNLKLEMVYWKQLSIYVLCSMLLSVACMYLVKGLLLFWQKEGYQITKLFIADNDR